MTKDEHKNRLTVIFVIWHRKSLSIGLEVSIVSSTKPEKRKRKNVATVLPLGRAGGFPQLVVTAEYVKIFCGWWHTITNSRHDFAVNLFFSSFSFACLLFHHLAVASSLSFMVDKKLYRLSLFMRRYIFLTTGEWRVCCFGCFMILCLQSS